MRTTQESIVNMTNKKSSNKINNHSSNIIIIINTNNNAIARSIGQSYSKQRHSAHEHKSFPLAHQCQFLKPTVPNIHSLIIPNRRFSHIKTRKSGVGLPFRIQYINHIQLLILLNQPNDPKLPSESSMESGIHDHSIDLEP